MGRINEFTGLTDRENEVLGLIGSGYTTKEIATMLRITPNTISDHRKHICKKLDLHSAASLIAYAAQTMKKLTGTP